ncbi:hypothetical protein D8674_013456 [Pyrus ussuriensis x Pyrus communis]|uniref:Uncharacterized protein n=1 Tax=Pyrus ussuriensis x Pyrus communis TaxID=2448454 RepID=A0A5N5GR28_9ROSA|nr:hypothetical protein D8674_013456 [Pyrus ussuriensis x Pyrus communis]
MYLQDVETAFNRPLRNNDSGVRKEKLFVFAQITGPFGDPIKDELFTKKDMEVAHWFILNNCDKALPYLEEDEQLMKWEHLSHLYGKKHHDLFPSWFHAHMNKLNELNSPSYDEELYNLARGPLHVELFSGCHVNGIKFLGATRDDKLSTQYSGVHVSGAGDSEDIDFYGKLTSVVQLLYKDRSEAFKLAAKFCYGINFEISIENIAMLRCVVEYLLMTQDYAEIFGKGKKKIELRQEHEKRVVLETIMSLLPREKNEMSVKVPACFASIALIVMILKSTTLMKALCRYNICLQMSAAAFAKGLLDLEGQLTPILVSLVSKDSSMWDGLDNASVEMEEAKVSRLNKIIKTGNNSATPPSMADGEIPKKTKKLVIYDLQDISLKTITYLEETLVNRRNMLLARKLESQRNFSTILVRCLFRIDLRHDGSKFPEIDMFKDVYIRPGCYGGKKHCCSLRSNIAASLGEPDRGHHGGSDNPKGSACSPGRADDGLGRADEGADKGPERGDEEL